MNIQKYYFVYREPIIARDDDDSEKSKNKEQKKSSIYNNNLIEIVYFNFNSGIFLLLQNEYFLLLSDALSKEYID